MNEYDDEYIFICAGAICLWHCESDDALFCASYTITMNNTFFFFFYLLVLMSFETLSHSLLIFHALVSPFGNGSDDKTLKSTGELVMQFSLVTVISPKTTATATAVAAPAIKWAYTAPNHTTTHLHFHSNNIQTKLCHSVQITSRIKFQWESDSRGCADTSKFGV